MAKNSNKGYILIILMFAILVISMGFLLASPVWRTQVKREKEAELIFRGKQYVEAIRIYQMKNPGKYPEELDKLVEDKYLRRFFKDPMTKNGEWGIICLPPGISIRQQGAGGRPRPIGQQGPGGRPRPGNPQRGQRPQGAGRTTAVQKILVVPQAAIESIPNPRIIGVVSLSNEESMKIYNDQTTYDKWLFFYGQDPEKMPEIVYYGQEEDEKKK